MEEKEGQKTMFKFLKKSTNFQVGKIIGDALKKEDKNKEKERSSSSSSLSSSKIYLF